MAHAKADATFLVIWASVVLILAVAAYGGTSEPDLSDRIGCALVCLVLIGLIVWCVITLLS